jgi:DNA-binding transcriptional MerR regulator
MSNTRRKVVRNLEEEHDLFDVVYHFLISENLTEQEVLDIMTHVSIDEILDLIEEYQDLTPEKEERVKNRVGELARDIELSAARVRELRKKPFAKHRPGIRKQAAEILKNAKKKQKLVQNASDALIRTSTSRSAKIQKRIEDLKNS